MSIWEEANAGILASRSTRRAIAKWLREHADGYEHGGDAQAMYVAYVLREKADGIERGEYEK